MVRHLHFPSTTVLKGTKTICYHHKTHDAIITPSVFCKLVGTNVKNDEEAICRSTTPINNVSSSQGRLQRQVTLLTLKVESYCFGYMAEGPIQEGGIMLVNCCQIVCLSLIISMKFMFDHDSMTSKTILQDPNLKFRDRISADLKDRYAVAVYNALQTPCSLYF